MRRVVTLKLATETRGPRDTTGFQVQCQCPKRGAPVSLLDGLTIDTFLENEFVEASRSSECEHAKQRASRTSNERTINETLSIIDQNCLLQFYTMIDHDWKNKEERGIFVFLAWVKRKICQRDTDVYVSRRRRLI